MRNRDYFLDYVYVIILIMYCEIYLFYIGILVFIIGIILLLKDDCFEFQFYVENKIDYEMIKLGFFYVYKLQEFLFLNLNVYQCCIICVVME